MNTFIVSNIAITVVHALFSYTLSLIKVNSTIAMARCLITSPDIVEDFVERVVTLIKDIDHGVLVIVV